MFDNHLIACNIFEEIKILKKKTKKKTDRQNRQNSQGHLFHLPKPVVSHRFLLIVFNQSLIESMKEFAFKYEAKSPGDAHKQKIITCVHRAEE